MKLRKYLLLIPFAVVIGLTSCNPDDEEDDVVTGDIRDNLEGTWRSQENSDTYGPSNYYVEIMKDTTSTSVIYIDNFFNLGLGKKMPATVSGSIITLNSNLFEGFIFSGNGSVASTNKTITWNYTFDDGNGPETVSGTYSKL